MKAEKCAGTSRPTVYTIRPAKPFITSAGTLGGNCGRGVCSVCGGDVGSRYGRAVAHTPKPRFVIGAALNHSRHGRKVSA